MDIARGARDAGLEVAAVALQGLTDPALEKVVASLDWVKVGELRRLIDAFAARGVADAVMAGVLPKTVLYSTPATASPDALMRRVLGGLPDLRDHSILAAIADALEEHGVHLRPQAELIPGLMAERGCLGAVAPTAESWADVVFGWPIAKAVARLQIGQAVAVKNRAVMAVEAIEGTDAAIARGCALAGGGASIVKVVKADQDPRFDLPTIGLATARGLAAGGAATLAVEAGATIVLDRAALLREADAHGIAVVGVGPEGPAEGGPS